MENVQKVTDADLLHDLIELNKKKYKIMNMLANLELNDNMNKEYSDLIDTYQIVCKLIRDKVSKIDDEKKNELLNEIKEINKNLSNLPSFAQILKNVEGNLPLQKTLIDLGAGFMTLYVGDNDSRQILQRTILNMLGVKTEEPVGENPKKINAYLTYDFVNMLYVTMLDEYKYMSTSKMKEMLINLKYNLIYISDDMEHRALTNRFSISNKPSLVDEITIRTAGITKDEYLKKSDIAFSRWVENYILEAVQRVYDDKLPTIDYLDHLIIKTLSNLIIDKELCTMLILPPRDEMDENIRKATMTINKDLMAGRKMNTEKRKIMLI